ncbi:MAG TPA: chitobiase/beta-hexosaminidase C-terminal domain-containing protein [archaeon]|nr:chitobiase/beta-hexosaminidase C-terminal domain-containing protein [archaeon]
MKSKGQASLEGLIIFGIFVIGAIIVGAFYFSSIKPKSVDNTELNIESNKIFKDELNKNYVIYPPLSSYPSGTVTSGTEIVLRTIVSGGIIRYTLDESEPTESSSIYNSPITITQDLTLKAKTYKTGYDPSTTATFQYDVE